MAELGSEVFGFEHGPEQVDLCSLELDAGDDFFGGFFCEDDLLSSVPSVRMGLLVLMPHI